MTNVTFGTNVTFVTNLTFVTYLTFVTILNLVRIQPTSFKTVSGVDKFPYVLVWLRLFLKIFQSLCSKSAKSLYFRHALVMQYVRYIWTMGQRRIAFIVWLGRGGGRRLFPSCLYFCAVRKLPYRVEARLLCWKKLPIRGEEGRQTWKDRKNKGGETV